jgi:predicted  nucleic acid-binding Zn-ribbon protein
MAHPLEALLVLQEKDRKVAKLQREIRDIPMRKAEVETQLEKAKGRLAESREAQMQLTSDLKQLEIDVADHREKIEKYKNQQLEVKTNDQYRALLHEVAAEEASISDLEDLEIALMDKLDAAKKVVEQHESELAEEEEGIKEEQEMLMERLAEVQEDLESVVQTREKMAANIDQALLMKYQRIFANKRDFAVVRVENGHCKGCNMRVPPQVVNDALNPAKLVACNYCGRMLINQ